MRRREFITLLGGAAAAWPLAARAQQSSQMRRVGALMNFSSADPEGQARIAAFRQALSKLGWIEGGNLHTEIRWAGDNPDLYRRYAEELVALTPDVILASGGQSVEALQRLTHSIPIIMANVIDPVGAGFITSLSRPGGNTTGFISFEYSIAGKWLDVLKELAPTVTRVAVLRDPSYAACIGQFAAIQSATSSSGVELSAVDERDASEIERAITTFAREPNGGVIITASSASVTHRDFIISLLTRYRLPNVYPFKYYPTGGGLASYGAEPANFLPPAAVYVDRILKGERPADLPVQAPTKYELVINLKTAKALGLNVPQTLLARADEVIE
jgi:putative tryptophan/tyrosine transport system substrate-binding protein